MATIWRNVVAVVVFISAIVVALPNHMPSASGVLDRRLPNHTPSAPGVIHRRFPDHTPSAPGVFGRQVTVTAASPTAAIPTATSGMAVQQLVAGIDYNIMAQKGEIAVVDSMKALGQLPATNPMLFQVAKDDLLSFMSASMRIRGNNMQLSGVNPQITRGLAQLEEAQVLQMALANNLTGDATNDGPILQKLAGAFQAAIQKNQGLQSLATGGSNVPVPMMTKPAGVL